MIEDEPIDLKMENRRLGNELSLLRQKNEELKEDRDYIKSLLDVEFEKRIKLSKENEQLKNEVYDWKASAEDYLKLGQSLKNENEQLKQHQKNTAKEFQTLLKFIRSKGLTLTDYEEFKGDVYE